MTLGGDDAIATPVKHTGIMAPPAAGTDSSGSLLLNFRGGITSVSHNDT